MLVMLLRMSAATALYVLLALFLAWRTRRGRLSLIGKLGVGALFGLCAVLSTHFGVDYGQMLLNVRDLGPLAAGLFFDPLSGVLAGLIGGIERYIAGTYYGVGAFTSVACSASTCLAGFLTPVLHILVFRRKKPSAVYAFFTGAVIEVFHMYAVFVTHRDDKDMAFSVVRTCATPMILFTGLGLAAISVGLQVQSGEWRNPLRHLRQEDVPVSQKFQFWLFAVTTLVLLVNFALSYAVQTQIAIQHTRDTLANVSEDIRETYIRITETLTSMMDFTEEAVLMEARAIAEAVEAAADNNTADEALLEDLRVIYGLESVTLVGPDGRAKLSAGHAPVYTELLSDVLSGQVTGVVSNVSANRTVAGSRCLDGMIQAVIDPDALLDRLNVADMSEALSFFHVGNTGAFGIIVYLGGDMPGVVMVGDHSDADMTPEEMQKLLDAPTEAFFLDRFFGVDAVCLKLDLESDIMLLTQLPLSEVYSSRDIKTYEYAFAGILLFAVIYTLVSMLVQRIVVNNIQLVNASLARITGGDLNEVVGVRSAREFARLSDDINQTVDVLKSYIDAAEKRIEQELEFARTIQESTLPRRFDFPRREFEIFATMNPAKEVGGDFYDFFFVAMDRVTLVIADVSGKGIPAALFMMRAKTAIRAQAERGLPPAEILFNANNTLCDGNDAEMFVTVWLGIIDLKTGVMQCANAGHEYPAIMRAGGDFELFKERHTLAVAAMEGMRFKEYEITLNPGDRIFVYTDGIPEAINERTEQYGAARMLEKLNSVKDQPLAQILPAVRQDIADFAGGAEQFDDITMLGLTYLGSDK